MKFAILGVFSCLALFAALGIVSPSYARGLDDGDGIIRPALAIDPFTVVADDGGCASVLLAGHGFSHTTAVTAHFSNLVVTDPYGTVYFAASGDKHLSLAVDSDGNFSQPVKLCGMYDIEPVTIFSTDDRTYLPSNIVNFDIIG